MFSPAYGIHLLSQIAAWIGDISGWTPMKSNGQILYGHAGREVIKATSAYNRWVNTQVKKDSRYIPKQLRRVSVWMANTKVDIVIRRGLAADFMTLIQEDNPIPFSRESHLVPYTKPVLHDNITTEKNPLMPQFLESLQEFINSLVRESDRAN